MKSPLLMGVFDAILGREGARRQMGIMGGLVQKIYGCGRGEFRAKIDNSPGTVDQLGNLDRNVSAKWSKAMITKQSELLRRL
jgi:hypothetical protein